MSGSRQDGFSLIELMIALAISGIIMGSLYTGYATQRNMYNSRDAIAEMQQHLRGSTIVVGSDLRMAGYNGSDTCTGTGFTAATSTTLTFVTCADDDLEDNDNDGFIDELGESARITYDLYDAYGDGVNDLGRQVGTAASSKRALAERVERIEFSYTLADGTVPPQPVVLTPAQRKNIRSIQISILARSGRQDMGFTDTSTYTSASGAVWGPYNDHVRRRLLTTTINCRNMGL